VHTSTVERWRDAITRLRRDKGAGPTAIHDWLRLNESGYQGSVSAVKRMCQRLDREEGPKATDVAIPVETVPGDVAQVDFVYAGKRYDPERGVLRAHLLAERGTSFFAAEDPGEELRRGFPGSLHGRAMALPDRSIALRRQLDAWFHEQRISPRITAEVDDSGLLAAFGNAGAGVFPAPAVLERSIVEAWNVRPIGRADTVRESFYAITRERQVELPAIREIVETTRSDLFAGPPRARPTPARRSA